jgi:hypothetical protein
MVYCSPEAGDKHNCRASFTIVFDREKNLDRRDFIKLMSAMGAATVCGRAQGSMGAAAESPTGYKPGRIENEYSLLLPGEAELLKNPPQVQSFHGDGVIAITDGKQQQTAIGGLVNGWVLLASLDINGVQTAVFERHVTHRGAIAYVTERGGTIALIPKGIGQLDKIRPRPTNTSKVKLERPVRMTPGPDVAGEYLLRSSEDPCYENVAALGKEYIGWTLVSSDGAGPMRSVYLEADGTSRQPKPNSQASWAPDLEGSLFNPVNYFPFSAPEYYEYVPGYSKRTLLGGYLPVANIGVWNPEYNLGYEVMMLLPPAEDRSPVARIRVLLLQDESGGHHGQTRAVTGADGRTYAVHYWNTTADTFYRDLAGVWNHWKNLYEEVMPVEIPDQWLLDAARAGITLSRCSYRGFDPTYQIGEGAYTKIPERSHALFPVAHYEFIWAQQLWGLADDARPYMQHYLDHYILPDGNFTYNTQDQVEAPLNVGIFLMNAARDYWYTHDITGFERQRPILEKMLSYVLKRYEYGKTRFEKSDRRYGLIWGSPEADLGDPGNDYPDSHPLYYQNAACVWRGIEQYARVLQAVGNVNNDATIAGASETYAAIASEMRGNIQRSIEATIAASTPEMRAAGIIPFEPNDILRKPTDLSSYENHRFMMDWFLADWGVPAYDEGHFKHRELAGQQICGLNTDGDVPRTSNFMEHGTLAARIRMEDYRPFLLTLYALVCYASDSGNRYAPEDAYIPGSYPGEQSPYGWSAVINSTLQPTLGLRWLLCYEENDRDICHLQKAVPSHWFRKGERISVQKCPTRFGHISWTTEATSDSSWAVSITCQDGFSGDIHLHIHPSNGDKITSASVGNITGNNVLAIPGSTWANQTSITITVQS